MLTIKGNVNNILFKMIQHELDRLSIQYKIQESDQEPYIMDHNNLVKGEHNITQYLQDLEKELKYWHYCSC